jgi:hypothetical protein
VPAGAGRGTLIEVPDVETRPAEIRPDLDEVVEPGEPVQAHIVKVGPGESAAAKVTEARIYGTPVEALCGFVWVPSRDPRQLPLCAECKSIYETYKAFNDGLRDRPDD